MQKLKVLTPGRKLTFPIYNLPKKKIRQKSCFIDSNRVDTVKDIKASDPKN